RRWRCRHRYPRGDGVPHQGCRRAPQFRPLFLEGDAGARRRCSEGGLSMPSGIKDKVVILGMGCSRFGERWDCSPEDLMVEAYNEAMGDAGITPEQLDAAWFSTHMSDVGTGRGGLPMSIALRLPNIGVTRVENFCAGG